LAQGSSVIDAQLEAGFDSASGFREAFARMVGPAPADLRADGLLKADWIDTPIGPMVAVADDHALHLLEVSERKGLPAELKRLQAATRSAIGFGRTAPIARMETELKAYFTGGLKAFETPLALGREGFNRTVWEALVAIPLGETRSYAGLA